MGAIGDRIRSERERLGLTQPEFAELVGVSKGAISQWETNITTPKGKNLVRLSEITGRPESYLMSGIDEPSDQSSEKARILAAFDQMTPAQRRLLERTASAILEESDKP